MVRRILWTCALGLAAACGDDRASEPALRALTDGRDGLDDMRVSPDGRQVVVTKRSGDLDQLWVMDIDGSNGRALWEKVEDVDDPAWSPDGKTIVFAARRSGVNYNLYAIPVSGGSAMQLAPISANIYAMQYSPDGSQILFTSNFSGRVALWRIPSGGGTPTEVAPGVTSERGLWSPDGKRIAMRVQPDASSFFISIVDVASGVVTPLTTEGFEFVEAWSPDGESIVYMSLRTGIPDLWVVPSGGGTPRQLTVDVRPDLFRSISRDGRWVSYWSRRGGQPDIWIVPFAGGDARRVTNTPADEGPVEWTADGNSLLVLATDQLQSLFDVPIAGGPPKRLTDGRSITINPRLSPDGRLLVYTSIRGGLAELFIKPREGGEERPLVTGFNSTQPSWSPDGSMVAFQSLRDPLVSVWVVRVSDGKQWRVSPEGKAARFPQWLPDSRRLSYIDGVAIDSSTYMIVDAQGGTPTRLATVRETFSGRWSPDGSTYAFTQRTGVGSDAGVYTVPVSGGTPTLLTGDQKAFTNRPTWSGDGSLITYSVQSPDSGTVDVYVMAADGSNKRRITSRPVSERSPSFSADDKEIIFVRGLLAMDAVNIETGAIRTIFDGDLRISDWNFSLDRKSLVIGGRRDQSVLYEADVRALMREER